MDAVFYVKPTSAWEALERIGKTLEVGWNNLQVTNCSVSTQLGSSSFQCNCLGSEVFKKGWATQVDAYKTRPYLEARSISVTLANNMTLQLQDEEGAKRGPF